MPSLAPASFLPNFLQTLPDRRSVSCHVQPIRLDLTGFAAVLLQKTQDRPLRIAALAIQSTRGRATSFRRSRISRHEGRVLSAWCAITTAAAPPTTEHWAPTGSTPTPAGSWSTARQTRPPTTETTANN